MSNLIKQVLNATADEMSDLSFAVKKRYSELFPDWEIIIISIEKNRDHNEQIDHMIQRLEGIRNYLNNKSVNGKGQL